MEPPDLPTPDEAVPGPPPRAPRPRHEHPDDEAHLFVAKRLPAPRAKDGALPLPSPERALLPIEAQALLQGLDDVGARVDAFTARVGDVEKVGGETRKVAEDTRTLAKWLVGLGAAVAVLLVAFGIVLVVAIKATNRANHAADTLLKVQSSARATCEAGNAFRTGEKQLWDGLLSGQFTPPSSSPRTEEQQAAVERFRKFLDQQFALRDCSAPPPAPAPTSLPRPAATAP